MFECSRPLIDMSYRYTCSNHSLFFMICSLVFFASRLFEDSEEGKNRSEKHMSTNETVVIRCTLSQQVFTALIVNSVSNVHIFSDISVE
jgi:hypothetical protein